MKSRLHTRSDDEDSDDEERQRKGERPRVKKASKPATLPAPVVQPAVKAAPPPPPPPPIVVAPSAPNNPPVVIPDPPPAPQETPKHEAPGNTQSPVANSPSVVFNPASSSNRPSNPPFRQTDPRLQLDSAASATPSLPTASTASIAPSATWDLPSTLIPETESNIIAKSSGLGSSAIAGIVIGCFLGLVCATVLVKRLRRPKTKESGLIVAVAPLSSDSTDPARYSFAPISPLSSVTTDSTRFSFVPSILSSSNNRKSVPALHVINPDAVSVDMSACDTSQRATSRPSMAMTTSTLSMGPNSPRIVYSYTSSHLVSNTVDSTLNVLAKAIDE